MRILFAILLASLLAVFHPQPGLGQSLDESFNKANALYKNKDLAGAAEEFQKVVEILKKEKKAAEAQKIQMNVGVIYFQLEKYPEAISALESAMTLNPKPDEEFRAKLLRNLASAHHKMGNYTLRAKILEDLIKSSPKMDPATKADVLAELGDSYRRNEIYTKAVDAYQQSFKLFEAQKKTDKELPVLTALGLCQAKLGRYADAAGSIKKALELSGGTAPAQNLAEMHSNLSIVLWDQGEYPKALASVQQAQKIERDNSLKQNLSADLNNEGLIYKSVGSYGKSLEAIEQSISIAREIKDEKSEAIALGNRALVKRILGKNAEARDDYTKALAIYERMKFQEGTASCLLGLGKLYEIEDLNYQKAYEHYQKALAIYTQLGNIGYQAEAWNQIGAVLKKGVKPHRTTRDLIFADSEPVFISLKPEESSAKAGEAYKKALDLGTQTGRREIIWSARQGLGFIYYSQGKLPEALEQYKGAVGIVTGVKAGQSDSDLLGDYLKSKDDLFKEAIEVAVALYKRDKKPEHLKLQMEYQELFNKEIIRGAVRTANLNFQEKQKEQSFKGINESASRKDAVDRLLAQQKDKLATSDVGANKKESEEAKRETQGEVERLAAESKKLELSVKEQLDKWNKSNPNDADIFAISSQIDLDKMKKSLSKDQALVIYYPLNESLNILCITSEDVHSAEVPIAYEKLAAIIRDDFMYNNIELYGHSEKIKEILESAKNAGKPAPGKEQLIAVEKPFMQGCTKVLSDLYKILIAPIEGPIANKKDLVVVTSKYISYVPFNALVKSVDNETPHFLIYDKAISYARLSYFTGSPQAESSKILDNKSKIIAIADPRHKMLKQQSLEGAVAEVENLKKLLSEMKLPAPTVLINEQALETTWKEKIANDNYDIFYFATHGIPFAEQYSFKLQYDAAYAKSKKPNTKKLIDFYDSVFKSNSPLYGYLYMSYMDDGSDKDDGCLLLKEILEMDAKHFKNANLAILSACNTAVTYSPQVSKDLRKKLESDANVSKELEKLGWMPGIDQVCLVDTFIRRGFKNVIGTQWFADDTATSNIITTYIKQIASHKSAEALRQAQIAYLKNPPKELEYTAYPTHPFYWACTASYGLR